MSIGHVVEAWSGWIKPDHLLRIMIKIKIMIKIMSCLFTKCFNFDDSQNTVQTYPYLIWFFKVSAHKTWRMRPKRVTDKSETIWSGSMHIDQVFDKLCDNGTHQLSIGNCLRIKCRFGALTPVNTDDIMPTDALGKVETGFHIQ